MKFTVGAYWTVGHSYEVEAETLEQAIEMVEANDDNKFPIDGVGEYIDDTFQVDRDWTKEMNNE